MFALAICGLRMGDKKHDAINFALVLVIFLGVAAAGAAAVAMEINQIFTYISTKLTSYTTEDRSALAPVQTQRLSSSNTRRRR